MTFDTFWATLKASLRPGDKIRNWTAAKGYLGDDFTIAGITDAAVEVDSPRAETIQHIAKNEFEFMYTNWERYSTGRIQRRELADESRFSKYTISIIKHL